jgi:hypothetical protein
MSEIAANDAEDGAGAPVGKAGALCLPAAPG